MCSINPFKTSGLHSRKILKIGKNWEGPKSFDRFFRDIEDRWLLTDPIQWGKHIPDFDLNDWKGALRFAGISWKPKLIRYKNDKGKSFQRKPINPWENRNWAYWDDYCSRLKPQTYYNGTTFDTLSTKLIEQHALEFFPDCLPNSSASRIATLWQSATAIIKNYNKMRFDSHKTSTHPVDSLALFQMLHFPWLIPKKSLLHSDEYIPPSNAYLPGRGLGGLLPEIDIRITDDQAGRELTDFLVNILKVNESLPESTASEWSSWLKRLPSKVQNAIEAGWKSESIKTAINTLFKKIFTLDQAPPGLEEVLRLPCLSWKADDGKEVIEFGTKDSISWLDKPYLADTKVKSALLKYGINLFIRELDEGTKASEWMGVQRLSDRVMVKHKYTNENKAKTEKLRTRFSERQKYLAKLPTINKMLPEIEFKVVDQLELELFEQKTPITSTSAQWWHHRQEYLVNSHQYWRGGALAIANSIGKKNVATDIEVFLKADDEQELINLPESEVRAAQAQQGNYWMAVLVPDGENEDVKYQQYWLNNPLETLAKYCEKGMWHWKSEPDDLNPCHDGWGLPESPTRQADRFEFRIQLPEDALSNPFISFENFCKEINRS